MSIDEETLKAEIMAFLDAHTVLSLATAGKEGAHAASVMYARDGFSLFWVSDPTTRHSRELEAESRVAVTIAPHYEDFRLIRGLQIHGRAHRLEGSAERTRGIALLAARFPFLEAFLTGPAGLRSQLDKAALYRLEPGRIVLVDNARGFGHRDVLDLGPRGAPHPR